MAQQFVDFLASISIKAETLFHPDATILPGFPRSLQLDRYSCGAKSVYCILKYYRKPCTPESVGGELGTDEEGTDVSDIMRVLKKHGLVGQELKHAKIRDIKAAINNGHPVLITIDSDEHYSAVFGQSDSHILVSNPSLNLIGHGSIRCAVPKSNFLERWDNWGIVVSK